MPIYKYRMAQSRFQSSFDEFLAVVENEEGVNVMMDIKSILNGIFLNPNESDITSSNHPFQRYGPGVSLEMRRERIWEDIEDVTDSNVESALHMMLDMSDTALFDAFTNVLSRFRIYAICSLPGGSDSDDSDSDSE